MSTVVEFMPMNLRLYDDVERDLRTYVSPSFSCVAEESDGPGANTHVVADNGGGKSTLLLFFELLFCKPDSQSPNVGGKKVVDYLRRAADDLHDPTPTTMAAVVRRDNPALMRASRDVVFGYVARLRGSERRSLDLRRFVIHLDQCPGYSLDKLARDCVYDASGAPLMAPEVVKRLREVPGCELFDSSDWDNYAQQMADAGVSPILWRELARMNANEEAAEGYFHTKDAFRKIVGLVQEAQQLVSGERAKPLADVAVDVARNVAAQQGDRLRRDACEKAVGAVHALAEGVREFAEAREGLKLVEDEADALRAYLGRLQDEFAARLDELEERADTFDERRRENERLHLSERLWALDAQLLVANERALVLRDDYEAKRALADQALKNVTLDDAARSWQRYGRLEVQIKDKQQSIETLLGKIGADEALAAASSRAWRNFRRAEAGADALLARSEAEEAQAREALVRSVEEDREAERAVGERERELGGAESTLKAAREALARAAQKVPGAKEMQTTLDGLFAHVAVEAAIKAAARNERDAAQALQRTGNKVERDQKAVDEARSALAEADKELTRARGEDERWQHNLEVARERDAALRSKLSLWEDVVALAVEGRYDAALERARELRRAADADESAAQARAQQARSRLDALAAGRLDMSEGLRSWLDRHGISAQTLASHAGMPDAERDRLFEGRPWLAHALVVDDAACAALTRAATDDALAELGHAVFYVRQADVWRLVDASRTNDRELVGEDGRPLVGALHTVERGYLEDPQGFEDKMRARLERAQAEADEARRRSQMLDEGRNAVAAFAAHLALVGMPADATFSDVVACADAATRARERAEEERLQRSDELSNAEAVLEAARDALVQAQEASRAALERCASLRELEERNEACAQAQAAREECAGRLEAARQRRDAAKAAEENARERASACEDDLRRAHGERDAVEQERLRLASVCEEGSTSATDDSGAACSIEKLRASVEAVVRIVTSHNEDLKREQERLEELRTQLREERTWKDKLRDAVSGGVPITLDEVKAWVPCDDVEHQGLTRRQTETRARADEAQAVYQDASVNVKVLVEQGRQTLSGLRDLQLDSPLEVPQGYDYRATAAAIDEEERADAAALREARGNKDHATRLEVRASEIAMRSERDDEYRASAAAAFVEFEDLASYDVYAGRLDERCRDAVQRHRHASNALDTELMRAKESVAETGEHTVARNVEESVGSVRQRCRTLLAMQRVAEELSNRSGQFQVMANNLREKLRTTDESIDDLVNRTVEEGYLLATELHKLVVLSRANVTGSRKQPTIEFRAHGSAVFRREVVRDELATARLSSYVRALLTTELPERDESKRQEYAKSRLAPHELVYQVLGERTVDVRYPVIRGGRSLSYESARDAGGSGSTGQKTAGYVLSFLALLRYLGNAGVLSSEPSLFVALENQFGKISSTSIIRDIKKVSDQMRLQLITVAGRELGSAYEMAEVVFSLYSTRGVVDKHGGSSSAMRARRDDAGEAVRDAVIDHFRATRRFENLSFDLGI